MEQRRLKIPRGVPVAVQQWQGLIAVNYAARSKGVTRHMRVNEAKQLCPQLVLVHVETIGDATTAVDEHRQQTTAAAAAAPAAASNEEGTIPPPAAAAATTTTTTDNQEEEEEEAPQQPQQQLDTNNHSELLKLTQKACLERYRRANSEIMTLLHRLIPTAVIEKASIDEMYIDATPLVDAQLEAQRHGNTNTNNGTNTNAQQQHQQQQQEEEERFQHQFSPEDAFSWGSVVLGEGPLDPGSEFDVRLACGAGIACRLRGAIQQQLEYSSSAGIATNKMLAKIGSALHKPNQQTLIPSRAVPGLMHDLALKKIRNFGGKLGEKLATMGCVTAGQVAALPMETLVKTFGIEKSKWIADAVRGINNDPVEEKERPKSMLAAKSFTATSDVSVLQRWFGILAAELAPRMATDEEMFKRQARTLSVHFRGGMMASGQDRSRQGPMPRVADAESIARAAWDIFKSRGASEALPCNRLGISAGDFVDLPAPGKSGITKFLVKPAKKQDILSETKEEEDVIGVRKRAPAAGEDEVEDGKKVRRSERQEEGVDEVPEGLSGVDIAEQKRLLKEAALLKELGRKRGKGGGGGGKKSAQPNIANFFGKKGV